MKKVIPIPDISYEDMNVSNIGPINKFLGVTTLDPFNAPVGSATSAKNLTGDSGVFPALSTRPNFAVVGTGFGASVNGMGLHLNSTLNVVTGGTWRKYNGTSWTDVLTGLNTTAKWSFTNFKGSFSTINLIAVNGVDAPRKYDGTTVSNLAGVPAGINFKMIDQHDNRLYASDGKAVYFCALRKGEDWSTLDEAGTIQIETNTGEDVTAIKAGMKHLMVFKRNAFFELWGTGPHNYTLQQVSETGAVGLNAVTVHDEAAYWISDSGAFRYTGGLPRKDFSLPVLGFFQNINKTAAQNACTISTKDSVIFSIPTGTSTVNDTTLQYLPNYGVWFVWQDFSPTQWTFWNDKLTYGDGTGVYQQAGNGTAISWEWISPPFGGGAFSARNQWYKLHYLIDVPSGSSLNVYVSRKAEGDTDWILVNNSYATGDSRRVILPISQVANSNFLRVKLAGTGPVKFHELNIQQRVLPLL